MVFLILVYLVGVVVSFYMDTETPPPRDDRDEAGYLGLVLIRAFEWPIRVIRSIRNA